MKETPKNTDCLIFQNAFYNMNTGALLAPIETQNYVIVQVAESHYGTGFTIADHKQFCHLELTFPTTNGLVCAANGKQEKLEKYEVYLSFQEELHKLSSRSGCRFQTLAINFKDGPCSSLLQALQAKFCNARKAHVTSLTSSFSLILDEFIMKNALFSKQYLDCMITSILIELLRTEKTVQPQKLDLSKQTFEIIHYIDLHFLDIYSIDELSKWGYSYSHICKIFKKQYGISPNTYLISKKMEHAKKLLLQDIPLQEIAEILGYASPFNFSRAFKNHFNISPREFKNQTKNRK